MKRLAHGRQNLCCRNKPRQRAHCETLEPRTLLSDTGQAQAVASLISAALATSGGTDPIYMQYGKLTGDVTTKGYAGFFSLSSFQSGISANPTDPTGRGNGDTVSDIVVTRPFDISSIPLMQEAFVGKSQNVEIDFVKTDKGKTSPYLVIDLSDVLISHYSLSSAGGSPNESLSLNFTQISVTADDAKGQPEVFTYNVVTQSGTLSDSAAVTVGAPATGGDPIYMKYGNIAGDVTAKGYQSYIQLYSFSFGVSRQISTGGSADREGSSPSISEITITKQTDSASVPLLEQALGGDPADALIDFVDSSKTYLAFDFSNTLVSKFFLSNSGTPTETLALNFTKFVVTATTGKVQNSFSFDLRQAGAIAPAGAAPAADTSGYDPIFMRYGNIMGEVTSKGAVGEIELDSFTWGVSRQITGSSAAGRSTSAPTVSEIGVTKDLDSTSVPLMQQALNGAAAPVEIDFADSVSKAGSPYLKIVLSEVFISSYSMSSNGGKPTESLTLNFTKINITHIGAKGVTQSFIYTLGPIGVPIALASPPAPPPSPATSGDPIYLKYGGITGDVTAKAFKGYAQLSSFSWGISRPISGNGAARGAGDPVISDIAIGKNYDSATVPLLAEAADGNPTSAEVDFVSNSKAYLKFIMNGTLVSSDRINHALISLPTESLMLDFTGFSINATTPSGQAQSVSFNLTQPGAAVQPAVVSAGSPVASPSDPIFMQYGGVTGDVTTKGAVGDISVNSLQWGIARGVMHFSNGGRQIGAASFSEVEITKSLDSATVPLLGLAYNGKASDVEIDFDNVSNKGAIPYIKFQLSDVLLSSDTLLSTRTAPVESLTLDFTKITVTSLGSTATTPPQTFSFDLMQNPNAVEASSSLPLVAPFFFGYADYMQYGNIQGDVTEPGFVGYSELDSFQWKLSRAASISGGIRNISQVVVSAMTLTEGFDGASLGLVGQVVVGGASPATIDFTSSTHHTQQTYLALTLNDAVITGDVFTSNGGTPEELLSMVFGSITIQYTTITGQIETITIDLTKGPQG